jgi:uncharacterized protein (TIGR02246 family)
MTTTGAMGGQHHRRDPKIQPDDKAIRNLIDRWMRATTAGDLDQILALMADDVVFLIPGRPPMRGKQAFAHGFQIALQHVRIESRCEIQEIKFSGAWAYCWNHLWVTVTPLEGLPQRREGYTLSIFEKNSDGNWLLVRDANMLTLEPAT